MTEANTEIESEGTNQGASPAKMSAGQRLAAAKAAKAARKAAQRGLDAQELEERALQQAHETRDWLQDHAKSIVIGLGVFVVIAAGVLAWSTWLDQRQGEAAQDLWAAQESVQDDEDASVVLAQYQELGQSAEGTPAGTWAKLGEAKILLEQGEHEAARTAYQAVLSQTQEDPAMRWLAMEGMVYTYEATKEYEKAIALLQQLRQSSEHLAPLADYHQARILSEQGDKAGARDLLKALVNTLNQPNAPKLALVQERATEQLAALEQRLAKP